MTRRAIIALSAVGCMLVAPPLGASAQPLDLKTPARDGPPERFDDRYPHRPPVPSVRGFLAPLSKETEGGRMGVAGWTIPNTPVGSRAVGDPDNAGWLGFGFARERGGSTKANAQN
jgi:hypothetical protein